MPKPRRIRKPVAPARCAGRPRHGGLVVPWITAWAGERPVFGIVFPIKPVQAVIHRRCQLCGQPLGRRIGLVVRPRDVEAGYVDEPAMHPECLDYAVAVCPMLNGAMDRHRSAPPTAVADMVAATADRSGQPAEAYDAWYITPSGYGIAHGPDGSVLGIRLADVPVLMKKLIRTAARPRLTGEDTERLAAVLDLFHSDTQIGPDQ